MAEGLCRMLLPVCLGAGLVAAAATGALGPPYECKANFRVSLPEAREFIVDVAEGSKGTAVTLRIHEKWAQELTATAPCAE